MARPVRVCIVDDCDSKHYGRGYCSLHYFRLYQGRNLDGSPHGNSKEIVGYRGAHYKVERSRGKARTYFCVDCDRQAEEWSLADYATNVLVSASENSLGKRYSTNVSDYEPRCIKCHRDHDENNPHQVRAGVYRSE